MEDVPSLHDLVKELKEKVEPMLREASDKAAISHDADELFLRRFFESLSDEQLETLTRTYATLITSGQRKLILASMHGQLLSERWRRNPIGAVGES